ncbi:MAG: hypothetical protein K2V38_22490, partial [Gemmataceae bacterium]|nr:hypothetical protein [Gemmataceae bacterium]
TGVDVGAAPRPANGLLMIQGPLVLDWTRKKFGILPKVENGCLQKSQPPDTKRLVNWLRARVTTRTKPNWLFVKLHTHGCHTPNQDVLLGEPMVRLHEMLSERMIRNPLFRFHYVTAREMANIALAAEQNLEVSIQEARSFRYIPLG